MLIHFIRAVEDFQYFSKKILYASCAGTWLSILVESMSYFETVLSLLRNGTLYLFLCHLVMFCEETVDLVNNPGRLYFPFKFAHAVVQTLLIKTTRLALCPQQSRGLFSNNSLFQGFRIINKSIRKYFNQTDTCRHQIPEFEPNTFHKQLTVNNLNLLIFNKCHFRGHGSVFFPLWSWYWYPLRFQGISGLDLVCGSVDREQLIFTTAEITCRALSLMLQIISNINLNHNFWIFGGGVFLPLCCWQA